MRKAELLNFHLVILLVCSKMIKVSSKYNCIEYHNYRTEGSDRLEGIIYKVTQNEIVVSFREMHDFVISILLYNTFIGLIKITSVISIISK